VETITKKKETNLDNSKAHTVRSDDAFEDFAIAGYHLEKRKLEIHETHQ